MPTPHNQAAQGTIAKTVLMPGDPLRAKYIAERFLTNPTLVNQVRNMFAYTGTYHGRDVTIMGSGMGMPSMGIYAHELYTSYGVETIIRVGTCGAYAPDVHVYDVILAQGACTDSNFASQYQLNGTFSAISSFELLNQGYHYAKDHQMNVHVGNVLSSDIFYSAQKDHWKKWASLGILAVEMESYALFATAAYLKKKALTVLTVSDSLVTQEATTPMEREQHFLQMMELALALV